MRRSVKKIGTDTEHALIDPVLLVPRGCSWCPSPTPLPLTRPTSRPISVKMTSARQPLSPAYRIPVSIQG